MASRLSAIRNQILPTINHRPISVRKMSSSSSSPSIAILDDYGGIASKHFQSISGLQVDSFPETLNPASEDGLQALAARLKPYTIISTMRERTPFPASLQSQLPNLKLLLTTGVRNASLDIPHATSQNIVIAGTTGAKPGHPDHSAKESTQAPPPPGYDSTTQHTWALILSICSRIPQDNAALRSNPQIWQSGFSLALGGKTLGLVGLGKLGANAARIGAQAFGMNVIAWSENLTQEKADAAAEGAGLPAGTFRAVSKKELFETADVVSLHYVLSPRSRGIVGTEELAMMKETSVLINSSRGPLIDEKALLDALERGIIRGAALDVWWQEPLPADSPWRNYKGKSDLVMSPHMGYVNEGEWLSDQETCFGARDKELIMYCRHDQPLVRRAGGQCASLPRWRGVDEPPQLVEVYKKKSHTARRSTLHLVLRPHTRSKLVSDRLVQSDDLHSHSIQAISPSSFLLRLVGVGNMDCPECLHLMLTILSCSGQRSSDKRLEVRS